MMHDLSLNNIPVDKISPGVFDHEAEVSVLRLDKIHPVISGNKWFKLQYYLEDAIRLQKKHIVTFGGAWSNHIVATAAICSNQGLAATGFIRGENPSRLSSTLLSAKESGMNLVFMGRDEYATKKLPEAFRSSEYYLIPEGGYGELGARGAATIMDHRTRGNYSHIACATGTGTMLAGLVNAALPQQQLIGISVLKNNQDLEQNVRSLLTKDAGNYRLIHDYHFGGYAKYTDELIAFMNAFYSQTAVPSDFVYTGKLFYGITQLIREKIFPPGVKLLVIHSGGLQGNDSLKKGTLIF